MEGKNYLCGKKTTASAYPCLKPEGMNQYPCARGPRSPDSEITADGLTKVP